MTIISWQVVLWGVLWKIGGQQYSDVCLSGTLSFMLVVLWNSKKSSLQFFGVSMWINPMRLQRHREAAANNQPVETVVPPPLMETPESGLGSENISFFCHSRRIGFNFGMPWRFLLDHGHLTLWNGEQWHFASWCHATRTFRDSTKDQLVRPVSKHHAGHVC